MMAPAIRPAVWSMITALDALDASIAVALPLIVPEFTMAAPPKVTPARMLTPVLAVIVPTFDRLPPKEVMAARPMPAALGAEMVPLLVMPLENREMVLI